MNLNIEPDWGIFFFEEFIQKAMEHHWHYIKQSNNISLWFSQDITKGNLQMD